MAPELDEKQLNERQRYGLCLARQGRSFCVTGGAGTGKTVFVKACVQVLTASEKQKERVHLTATTGVAGTLIGGTTVHRFAGIGQGHGTKEQLLVLAKKYSAKKWRMATTLIVDEVSMLDGGLLDKLDYIARCIRTDARPMGGIQLIVSGDFFQLPPVGERGGPRPTFAFEANVWKEMNMPVVLLTEVYRQHDPAFYSMLNQIRVGKLPHDACTALERHEPAVANATRLKLFATNQPAERLNATELAKLHGDSVDFEAVDTVNERELLRRASGGAQTKKDPNFLQDMKAKLLGGVLAPKQLNLKRGATVMCLRNFPDYDIVNGSVGSVVDFVSGAPVVAFTRGRRTHHVTFTHEYFCTDFEVKEHGKVLARRQQLPLKLAWAITIHKSQGMTLDGVEIDFAGIFSPGQAYVALSRARGLENTKLINFRSCCVTRYPPKAEVAEFYRAAEAAAESGPAKRQRVV